MQITSPSSICNVYIKSKDKKKIRLILPRILISLLEAGNVKIISNSVSPFWTGHKHNCLVGNSVHDKGRFSNSSENGVENGNWVPYKILSWNNKSYNGSTNHEICL